MSFWKICAEKIDLKAIRYTYSDNGRQTVLITLTAASLMDSFAF